MWLSCSRGQAGPTLPHRGCQAVQPCCSQGAAGDCLGGLHTLTGIALMEASEKSGSQESGLLCSITWSQPVPVASPGFRGRRA